MKFMYNYYMNYATVTCNLSGRKQEFFGDYLERKLTEFGSLEAFQKQYVCRDAKKLLKQNIPPEEIKLIIQEKVAEAAKPKVYESTDKPLTQPSHPESFEAWVKEFTGGPNGAHIKMGGTCVRPDIFLSNDRTCNNCECYQYCLCVNKKLKKK